MFTNSITLINITDMKICVKNRGENKINKQNDLTSPQQTTEQHATPQTNYFLTSTSTVYCHSTLSLTGIVPCLLQLPHQQTI